MVYQLNANVEKSKRVWEGQVRSKIVHNDDVMCILFTRTLE
jgi:hypothetical protein